MFVLQPKPTFKAAVSIPIPGGKDGKITFEFKHMGKKALAALFKTFESEGQSRDDVDILMDFVNGWTDVDTEFSKEALDTLCDAYPGAALAILIGYSKELTELRTKN